MALIKDIATVCKSKNAGPFELTVDVVFDSAEMFRRVMEKERRPFLGDASFFNCSWDLAVCEAPLLAIGDRQRPPGDRTVRLTAMGERVLAGQEDHVRLNGIDRWIGGVHLTGGSPAWRYDERLESLVRV